MIFLMSNSRSGLHFHKSSHRLDTILVFTASSVDSLERIMYIISFGSLLIQSFPLIEYWTLLLLASIDNGDDEDDDNTIVIDQRGGDKLNERNGL